MVGTGEALLNVRSRGGQPEQAGAKGARAADSGEFDFQGELQKFDKVCKIPGSAASVCGVVALWRLFVCCEDPRASLQWWLSVVVFGHARVRTKNCKK